jgi:hypothetical protein
MAEFAHCRAIGTRTVSGDRAEADIRGAAAITGEAMVEKIAHAWLRSSQGVFVRV